MATSNIASLILKQLDSTVDDIYKKYETLKSKQNLGYKETVQKINDDYDKSVSESRARLRIAMDNEMSQLEEKGLGNSGQATQARMMNNMGLMQAESTLLSAKNDKLNQAYLEKTENELTLEEKKLNEISSTKTSMYKNYISQLDKDRSYALREKSASKSSSKSTSSSNKVEVKPSQTASSMYKGIVKSNTEVNKQKGYTVIHRGSIQKTILNLLNDDTLSLAYRKELELYARLDGYIK